MEAEAKCAGLLLPEHTHTLINLLRGVCNKYAQIIQTIIMYRAPLQSGTTFTQFKVTQTSSRDQQPTAEDLVTERWSVVHEGAPMRGAEYTDLPATVREVTTCATFGRPSQKLWRALGAAPEYSIRRDGQMYFCTHAGFDVTVYVVKIMREAQTPGKWEPTGPEYFVEASTPAPEGRHAEAAHALGSFAQRLQPLVELRRAEPAWR